MPVLALVRKGTFTPLPGAGDGAVTLVEPADVTVGTVYNGADYGLRAETEPGASGVGSMAQGSFDLVMDTAAHGFTAGDPVAVEIGGEAGAGARNTVGVGGYLPGQSVATVAALPGTAGANERYYVEAEDAVYITYNNGTSWQADNNWYQQVRVPLSLVATVQSVAGATLTLDVAATVATTAATVRYDNARADLFQVQLSDNTDLGASASVRVNEGTYWMAGPAPSLQQAGLDFAGRGKHHTIFRGVKGLPYVELRFYHESGVKLHDFQIHSTGDPDQGHYTLYNTNALFMQSCTDSSMENVVFRDCPDAGDMQYCTDSWGRRLISYAPGSREYFQWQFQHPDNTRGGFEDCAIECDTLQAGFEPFKSVDAMYRRICGYNAYGSSNSASGSRFEDVYLRFAENAEDPLGYVAAANHVLLQNNENVGSAINPEDSVYRRVTTVRDGPANAAGDWGRAFIGGQGNFTNATIEDWVDWVPESARTSGARAYGILLGGPTNAGHTVTRARAYSTPSSGYMKEPLASEEASPANTVWTDCVADSIYPKEGTVVNLRTVAQWRAATDRTAPPVVDLRIEAVRGHGACDVFLYDVDETDPANPVTTWLTRSPWGVCVRYLVEYLAADGTTVLHSSPLPYSTFRFPGAGTYSVRVTAWDEDLQSTTATRTVVVPAP